MARRHELTDPEWEQIQDLLPGKQADPGRTALDNRLFVNAVLFVLKTGIPWADLPERYGKPNTVGERPVRAGTKPDFKHAQFDRRQAHNDDAGDHRAGHDWINWRAHPRSTHSHGDTRKAQSGSDVGRAQTRDGLTVIA